MAIGKHWVRNDKNNCIIRSFDTITAEQSLKLLIAKRVHNAYVVTVLQKPTLYSLTPTPYFLPPAINVTLVTSATPQNSRTHRL